MTHFVGVQNQNKMKNGYQIKQQRLFSEGLRKQIVGQVERREFTVAQVMREYQVSKQAVYNWLYRYSCTLKKWQLRFNKKEAFPCWESLFLFYHNPQYPH